MNAIPITRPGCYPGIAAEDYHGREICDGPSISSTGLKTIVTRSPLHYWWDSPLNPARPVREEKAHFAVGKAAHDMILLRERWPDFYHILPEDYDGRATKRCAAMIAEKEAAEHAGRTVLKAEQAELVHGMADAIAANPFAKAALSYGLAEPTLAWRDAETGVWCRARPDFLPSARTHIPDLKTAIDGSPDGFARAIANYGYHQSAAHYLDGIEAVFGERPATFFFVVVEKEAPFAVSLYQLPEEDIERGRVLNRAALRRFAECLTSGQWPGYATDVRPVRLPAWASRIIDQFAMEQAA